MAKLLDCGNCDGTGRLACLGHDWRCESCHGTGKLPSTYSGVIVEWGTDEAFVCLKYDPRLRIAPVVRADVPSGLHGVIGEHCEVELEIQAERIVAARLVELGYSKDHPRADWENYVDETGYA